MGPKADATNKQDQRFDDLMSEVRDLADDIKETEELGRTLSDDPNEIRIFRARISRLDATFKKFRQLVNEASSLGKSLDKEVEIRMLESLKATIREFYYKSLAFSIKEKEDQPDSFTVNESEGSSIELPRINIPTFNGDISKWDSFKDSFLSLVHNNTKLTEVQKFHYLKSSLKGPAAQAISSIRISARSYTQAWDSLSKRYENKRIQATNYLVNIFNFKPLQKSSFSALEQFSEIVLESATAFIALDLPDPVGFILYTYALRLLDKRTRERFENECSLKTEVPGFDFFSDFIHRQYVQLQSSNLTGGSAIKEFKDRDASPRTTKQVILTVRRDEKTNSCPLCQKNHRLHRCPRFLTLTHDDRYKEVKAKSLCINCLLPSHPTVRCMSPRSCLTCHKRHHTLLHFPKDQKRKIIPNCPSSKESQSEQTVQNTSQPSTSSNSVVLCSRSPRMLHILLGTALARIKDISGNYRLIRMVVDSGAQRSFITNDCANRLGLPRKPNPHTLRGFSDTPIVGGKYQVQCSLVPKDSCTPQLTTNAVVIPCISDHMPASPIPAEISDYFSRYNLSDPSFAEPRSIDFLLGADLFGSVITGERVTTPDNMPKAVNTIFGLVILGPINCPSVTSESSESALMALSPSLESDTVSGLIQRFWEVEEVATVSKRDPLDIKCEEHFSTTHSRDENGRYIVRLPFRDTTVNLGDSYHMALQRFHRLEMKLNRDPWLKQEYHSVIQEHLQLKYVSQSKKPGKYFLPHQGVLKASSSTKLRIVFDASAKTCNGSLNDKLLPGPKLQLDIRDVLLNFRLYPIALTADICQMFLQIWVHPEDRAYQHFLFRYNQADSVKEYEISRVPFGLTCSPFLAIRVLQQLVYDEGLDYPLASRALKENIYIDDILSGAETPKEALTLQKQLNLLLHKGGFKLKKWASNCELLLCDVPIEEREVPISLSNLEEPSIKILGMQWESRHDFLTYKVQPLTFNPTKRGIMSAIARMYDPLGYLAPVIFKAKTILQTLWKAKLDWDDPVDTAISAEWEQFFNSLPALKSIQIPRCIFPNSISEVSVVGFADASTLGYAAVVYLRIKDRNGLTKVHLLFAKTRLAPLKTLSIPRLELCAALLLVRTIKSLKYFLNKFTVKQTYLLTDSTIIMSWLRTPAHRLKTFVANRVVAILKSSAIDDWYHVKSEDNSADLASRGISPSLLEQHTAWWNGPSWLSEETNSWNISQHLASVSVPELKPETLKIMATSTPSAFIEYIEKYSSYEKLIRVFGHVMRFIENCRLPIISRRKGPLRIVDLDESTRVLVKITQTHYFNSNSLTKDTSLQALSPFNDKYGILRVGGRLTNSPLSYNAKHPILLPPRAHLTKLIIDNIHKNYLHAGPQLLYSLLQRRYWVISGRRLVRSRVHQCKECHRFKAKNYAPKMADLPKSRFAQGRPFVNAGIDFAGPFITKESLRKKAVQHKTYVCIFVCMSTKAVHLELISQLTTQAFLAGLDRFIGRRGLPHKILSDHGTNFVGADRKLKELYAWFKAKNTQADIINHLNLRQVNWEFIPPAAPHFGGLWEAGVKSFKYHLVRVLKDRIVTFEEFNTLIIRIEAVLNSRPLYPMSSSPNDFDILTPGHFIIGAPLLATPEKDVLDKLDNRLTRWEFLSKCIQNIWKRWRYDYLNSLQQRSKWRSQNPNIELDTLVLIKEPNSPPLSWPAGRIVELFPGPDGVVRVVKLKTANGVYIRPVSKLAPLLPTN